MADDMERVASLVFAAGGLDHDLRVFRVDGEPIAKARARVTRHRHYTPQRTLDAEADVAAAVLAGPRSRFDGNVAVAMIFYRSNRHRIDTDNLIKTVLDGITKSGAVWDDDSHVTAIVGITELDADWPRTVVAIAPHTSTMLRGEDAKTHTCANCGKRYRPHSPKSVSVYCSRACRPTKATLRACLGCGEPTSHSTAKRCAACHFERRRAA